LNERTQLNQGKTFRERDFGERLVREIGGTITPSSTIGFDLLF
jgi:hypothetical protein